jgi:hypothetical protein
MAPKKKVKMVPAVAGALPRIDKYGRQVYRDSSGKLFVIEKGRKVYVRTTYPKVRYTFGF